MAHLKLVTPLLAALGTCSPQPQPPASTPATSAAAATTAVDGAPPSQPRAIVRDCYDATCWHTRADAAAGRGALDVAAALRGRAFTRAPTAANLDAWLAALTTAGDRRGAHAALAAARDLAPKDASLRAAVDAAAARLPAAPTAAALLESPAPAVLAAREAQARGRTEDALAAYLRAGDVDAVTLADIADLLAQRGEAVEAARTRSRARTRLRDAGARLSLLAVETWHTQHALWLGDQLVLARYIDGIDDFMLRLGALELWSLPPDPAGPRRRHLLASPIEALTAAGDDRTIVRAERGDIVVQDMFSGTVVRRFRVGSEGREARIGGLLAVGAGDDLRVLVTIGPEATLWDARGQQIDQFKLAGTTPTITRAYTGEGAYHHNFLNDSPTWATALAMTPDATMVAIGGSDSKTRVYDRARKTSRVLEFTWTYTEHRHMGGNPDLNAPLALRFVDAGARLLAVHTHGERFLWDTRTGAAIQRGDGSCTREEAEALANRYTQPGEPRVAVRDEDLAACGRATLGAIAPDGGTIVTGGMSVARVRSGDGRPLVSLTDRDLPGQFYALSRGGELAMTSLYGRVDTWRSGQVQATTRLPAHPSGPIDPEVSPQGRFVRFEVQRPTAIVWDLVERRRVDATHGAHEVLLDVSGDGRFAAVHTGDAVEFRDTHTRARLARVPVRGGPFGARPQFSAIGALLRIEDDGGSRFVQVALPGGDVRTLDLPAVASGWRVSPDGKRLATYEHDAPGALIDLTTRAPLWPIDAGVRDLAFAGDGSALAWIVRDDPRRASGRALHRRIDQTAPTELALTGWVAAVAVSPDGADVMILVEGGELYRWQPATGQRRAAKDIRFSANRVRYVEGGDTLLILNYDRIHVVADDTDLTPLATLMPLFSGGWLAVGAAGAVDGSDDAPRSLVTRARTPAGDELLLPGSVAWDGALTPDVYPRALAGEVVEPPVL